MLELWDSEWFPHLQGAFFAQSLPPSRTNRPLNIGGGWNAAASVYIAFTLPNFLSACRLLASGSKKKPNSCNSQGQTAVLGDSEIGTKMT